ncbi:Gef1p [Sugiyamaella lignohabitans]|uniref:Gef1p n=1 Tax=Sugiyamaella lignohabitans TaxID=796027 RepID=A0A167DQB7_9ASCO|nr:Gef1p [Sugiyamaella lignohabitans]ANB13164.1 Gef1p [Sugiyamaella lignohabitans]
MLIAVITGCVTFFNPYTSKSVSELLYDLASPCNESSRALTLCPSEPSKIPALLGSLGCALLIKVVLTSVTFGVKVPAGIYVPSMVIGALYGRIFGLTLKYIDFKQSGMLSQLYGLDTMPIGGPYAMAGAGAFLAGVTRMNITLATILFELTGSLNHVLPFSIAILVSNWVANAIEPDSLYELLLERNNFPYLDNRQTRSFDSSLADLVNRVGPNELIDVGDCTHVSSLTLRSMASMLQMRGEFDGCIPLIKGPILVGIISVPQLDFALDRLQQYCNALGVTDPIMCKLSVRDQDVRRYHHYYTSSSDLSRNMDNDNSGQQRTFFDSVVFTPRPTRQDSPDDDASSGSSYGNLSPLRVDPILVELSDFTKFIDRAPIMLDIHSPLALVEMMFTKLGTRLICVSREGKFVGILHRKKYIEFCHSDKSK